MIISNVLPWLHYHRSSPSYGNMFNDIVKKLFRDRYEYEVSSMSMSLWYCDIWYGYPSMGMHLYM